MGMVGSVTPDMIAGDAGAFFDFLDSRPEVKGLAIRRLRLLHGWPHLGDRRPGASPERVAAAGSFHGGGLVTDDPNSPHLLADKMKATVYVAGRRERSELHHR